MSSKRAIRRRSCSGKQRYPDAGAALAAIRALRRRTGQTDWLQAYRCRFCGGWHFGHPPAKIRRAVADRRRVGRTG